MSKANQLPISIFKEGLNVLKAIASRPLGITLNRPVSVNLLLTTRCNSKCATCDSWKMEDHNHELTLKEYQRLAKEIAQMQIPIVTIGGGEPTLRTDLWDIIRSLKAEGLNVQVTTNGLNLRETVRDKLFQSGADRVTLSVDSHIPEVYEIVRGVNGAKSVLENLAQILKDRPPHLAIDTNTVLCKDNAATFLDTLDFLISIGVPAVNFSAVTTSQSNYLMKESKMGLADIPIEQIENIQAGLLERKKTNKAIAASTTFIRGLTSYYKNPDKLVYDCHAGYLTFDIFQNGNIHGCGNLPEYGNVRQASLENIWKSAEAQKMRSQMSQGKCPNCYLSCKIELAIAANPKHIVGFARDKLS